MTATSRLNWKIYWLGVKILLVLFPVALVIFMFSSCDVRKRSEKRACRGGDVDKCLEVGKYYEAKADGILGFLMSNSDTAITNYHRACVLKSPVGCERMVYLVDHADQAKNLSLELTDLADALIDGCAADLTGVCDLLWTYMQNEWAANRAANAFDRRCIAGEAMSCYMLARLHVQNMGGQQKVREQILPLYEKSCAGGIADGCKRAQQWRDAKP